MSHGAGGEADGAASVPGRLLALLSHGEPAKAMCLLSFCELYPRSLDVEVVTLGSEAALEAEHAGWFSLPSEEEKRTSRDFSRLWHNSTEIRPATGWPRRRLRLFTGRAPLNRERLVTTRTGDIFDRMTPRPGEDRLQYWISYHTDDGDYRFLFFPATAAGAPASPHSEFCLALPDGTEFRMPRGDDHFVLFPSGLPHAVLGEPRRPGDPLPARLRGFADDDRE